VLRPPGLAIDSGGLAKGLFADLLAERLAGHASFAVECAGDLRVGGEAGLPRPVPVASPFGGAALHTLTLTAGGVATSGIGRRSWLDAAGRPAHHLLDPSTGRPAYTGVVQATAVAPTALEAEIRAKAALLGGPAGAAAWLPDGGVLVFDDGTHEVVPAEPGGHPVAGAPPARTRSSSSSAIASAEVAAGEGALRTQMTRPELARRKSSTSRPSAATACARTPAAAGTTSPARSSGT
jgi:hypothetical protein